MTDSNWWFAVFAWLSMTSLAVIYFAWSSRSRILSLEKQVNPVSDDDCDDDSESSHIGCYFYVVGRDFQFKGMMVRDRLFDVTFCLSSLGAIDNLLNGLRDCFPLLEGDEFCEVTVPWSSINYMVAIDKDDGNL